MFKKCFTAILSGVIMMSGMQFTKIPAKAEGFSSLSVSSDHIVYVSPDAEAEGATGSIDKPFATIETARDYLRGKDITSDSRGIVYLREGVYHLTDSIELTHEDSYVTYVAYGGEKVEITGSAQLEESGFKKLSEAEGEQYSSKSRLKETVRDKVYVYDLGAAGLPVGEINKNGFNWTKQPLQPELVADGELQTLACYPNNGSVLTKSHLNCTNKGAEPRNYFFDKNDDVKTYEQMLAMDSPVFLINNNLPESARIWAAPYGDSTYSSVNGNVPEVNPNNDNTKYETDGWLSGYYANEYANDNLKLYSVRQKGSEYYIYCKYPSVYSVNSNSLKVTAINLLCELDTESEYYIDRYNGNNVLYYYPKNGELGSLTLTALNVPLVTMNGACEIQLSGIGFTGTTNIGITMTDCESCVIDSCELYNISMDAIRVGDNNGMITCDPAYDTHGGGHNNTVANCVIHDMGHGGVYLSGGERKSLTRGDNTVRNCEFYNISRLETYTPAVYLEGVGNTAQDNYIHDAPHMVIQIMGNDMLVTRNKIINTCYNANDMAPIYIGRDWSWLGNEICYNYIEDVHYKNSTNFDFGIYMDDNASGVIIHHNIFNKIGGNAIYLNKGYGSYVADNIVLNGTGPYYRYLTAGNHSWNRPIPNEKALKYRFFEMLRTEEEAQKAGDENKASTRGYWNTQENIDKWVEHYNSLYNSLPENSKNPDHAFDLAAKYFPAEGKKDAEVWTDRNSLVTQGDNTVVRNITVNTGDLWNINGFYNGINPSDAAIFDIKRHKASSVDALGLNISTGKIGSGSSLANDENYGPEWIARWNEDYSISGAGVNGPADKERLWRKIAAADALAGEHPELRPLLERAHAVAADGLAYQSSVDSVYNALVEALSAFGPQYDLSRYQLILTVGESAVLTVDTLSAEEAVVWKSGDASVAIVDRDGVVYALSEGEATVTAEVGGVVMSCEVKVEAPAGNGKAGIIGVTATSAESANPAQNAADGDLGTRWSSAYVPSNPYPQSIEFELEQPVKLGRIVVNLYYSENGKDMDRSYKYKIFGKVNKDDDYQVLVDRSDNTDKKSDVEFTFDGEEARYLKLEAYGCDKSSLSAFSIYEFTVYVYQNQKIVYDALDKEIAAAERILGSGLIDEQSPETLEALKAALETAKAVRGSLGSTQAEINSAQETLYQLWLALGVVVENSIALAPVSVIEGNAPVLPTVVNYADKEYSVKWETDFEKKFENVFSGSAGGSLPAPKTVTVTAASAEGEKFSVDVTVYPCTDKSLSGSINSVKTNGKDGAYKLGEAVKNDGNAARFEFDVTYNTDSSGMPVANDDVFALAQSSLDSALINGALGKSAVGMHSVVGATNNAKRKDLYAGFHGAGMANLDTPNWPQFKFEVGKKYRVFIETNVKNKTYKAVVTGPDGSVVLDTQQYLKENSITNKNNSKDWLYYRGDQTNSIDTLYVLSTYAADTITVSDFRVSWDGGTWDTGKEVSFDVNYTYEGRTVYTDKGCLGFAGAKYNIPAKIINAEDGEYLIDAQSVNVPENEGGAVEVKVKEKLTNVYTLRDNTVWTGNIGDSGKPAYKYTGKDNFAAFNHGSDKDYDRIGVAILDSVEAGESQILALSANKIRYMIGNGATEAKPVNPDTAVTSFYAISYDDYKKLDLNKTEDVYSALNSDNKVAEITANEFSNRNYQEANENFSIKLDGERVKTAAGNSGKVVIIGNSKFNLLALEGASMKIVATDIVVLDITPALGWDDELKEFTINFLFGDGLDKDFAYGVKVESEGEGDNKYEAIGIISGDQKGVGIGTVNTNMIYYATPFVGFGDKTWTGTSTKDTTKGDSIYSLVAEAVERFVNNNPDTVITKDQLEEAIKVINKGGIYLVGGKLTSEAARLMEVEKNENEDVVIISIKKAVADTGIRFRNIKGYIPGEDDIINEKDFVVSEDGKTITLRDVSTMEAAVFYLEFVELMFENDVVETVSDETAFVEMDFIMELL